MHRPWGSLLTLRRVLYVAKSDSAFTLLFAFVLSNNGGIFRLEQLNVALAVWIFC